MTKILGLLVWSCSVLLGTISAAADLRAGPHVRGDLEQPQVRLVGVVRDGTGAVLQGVSVTVSGNALPTSRAVVTDDQGWYAFDGLPPGKYVVTTMAEGFEPRSVDVVVGASVCGAPAGWRCARLPSKRAPSYRLAGPRQSMTHVQIHRWW